MPRGTYQAWTVVISHMLHQVPCFPCSKSPPTPPHPQHTHTHLLFVDVVFVAFLFVFGGWLFILIINVQSQYFYYCVLWLNNLITTHKITISIAADLLMQVIHTTLNKKQKVEYYSHACDVQLLSVSFFVVVLFIIDFIYIYMFSTTHYFILATCVYFQPGYRSWLCRSWLW